MLNFTYLACLFGLICSFDFTLCLELNEKQVSGKKPNSVIQALLEM